MSEQTQNQQQMSSRHAMENEIDLQKLFARVWQRKWWVTGITVLSVLLAVTYLLIARPVYRAELFLMPPSISDLAALNLDTTYLIHSLTTEEVYNQLLGQLRSKKNLMLYYDKAELDELYRTSEDQTSNDVLEKFTDAIVLHIPKKKEDLVFTSISLEGPSSEQVASHLNAYTDYVISIFIKQLVADLYSLRDQKIELLEHEIKSKREIAYIQRQDGITRFEEALAIANAVGISEIGAKDKYIISDQSINIMNLDELYLRGSKALAAEIKVLKSRVSDDPFIDQLRILQEELETLRAIKVDSSTIAPVHIDRQAIVPEKPERPKKFLVLVISILLGGMLGLFVALVVPAHEE